MRSSRSCAIYPKATGWTSARSSGAASSRSRMSGRWRYLDYAKLRIGEVPPAKHASRSLEKAYAIASIISEVRQGDPDPGDGLATTTPDPAQAYQMICAFGRTCRPENLAPPDGPIPSTWSLARLVVSLAETLASNPEAEAQGYLERLSKKRRLSPWKEEIDHAREQQRRTRRDIEFQVPSFRQVGEALANCRPANSRDLLALLVDHIESLARELRDGPQDDWKQFWNTDRSDPHSRVTEPRGENSCRDLLITLLNSRVAHFEVHLETESRHAEERRADVRAVMFHGSRPVHLPIEAKLPMHREVWTAIEGQLIPRYSRDPDSAGFGLYLVFWFGTDAVPLPTPPSSIERPTSANGLKSALERTIPEASRDKVKVVCLDLSPPPSRNS